MDTRRSVSILWVILALALGGFSGWQVHTDSQRAECQAQYNLAFTEQLRIRADLSAVSDGAQSDLLRGVSRLISLPPSSKPAVQASRTKDFRKLFSDFDAAVIRADKARRETPLPVIPDCAKS